MNTPRQNLSVRLSSYPKTGQIGDVLEIVEDTVREPSPGEIVVALRFVSVDPAMRIYMDPSSIIGDNDNLADTFVRKGQVMRSFTVGEVVESRSERFPVGSFVRDLMGHGGIQRYYVAPEAAFVAADINAAPLVAYVGALGMPGLTAYKGIVQVANANSSETVVISAAAGGVGGIAGQIAKARGCRVIGIAGGENKCRYVVEDLGFDACIDYKDGDLGAGLDAHCPDRIDVYFDNVGGTILDTCMARIATHGRIAACGAITTYTGASEPLYNHVTLLVRQARWEGISYYDLANSPAELSEASAYMASLLAAGALTAKPYVYKGVESFSQALDDTYAGRTMGKVIIQI